MSPCLVNAAFAGKKGLCGRRRILVDEKVCLLVLVPHFGKCPTFEGLPWPLLSTFPSVKRDAISKNYMKTITIIIIIFTLNFSP